MLCAFDLYYPCTVLKTNKKNPLTPKNTWRLWRKTAFVQRELQNLSDGKPDFKDADLKKLWLNMQILNLGYERLKKPSQFASTKTRLFRD